MNSLENVLKPTLVLTLIYPAFIIVFAILSLYNKSGVIEVQIANANTPMLKGFFETIYSLPVFIMCILLSVMIITYLRKIK